MPRISAKRKTGIVTPIAVLAPFDKPVAFTGGVAELGVPVVFGVLVADGILFDDEDDRLLVVGEGVDCVICSPSNDKIWISVFCHSTGIASQTAVVFIGTTQSVRLRCEGRFIATFGVGAGAGQTLVSVCPEMRAVLHPWLASTVDPCTQSQFLRLVKTDSSRGI
jgi:hypothetical protein